MSATLTLSDAKARLSEVVRGVRTRGEEAVITVDGEPAARVVPVDPGPRSLTAAEAAGYRALMASLARLERPTSEFDAVELIGEVARAARLRAYDAVYVALALIADTPLLTLDAEVVERCSARFADLRVLRA